MDAKEDVQVSFAGVDGVHVLTVLTPAWADEFLVPLAKRFGSRLRLGESENRSVEATLALLEQIHGMRFRRESAGQ